MLSCYTLINTLLCEVYFYFRIPVSWYHALFTITGITYIVWEGNRLLERVLWKMIPSGGHKIKFVIYFFLAGNVLAGLATLLMVSLTGVFLLGLPISENVQPFKLNLIYATLANLFLHLLLNIDFPPYR